MNKFSQIFVISCFFNLLYLQSISAGTVEEKFKIEGIISVASTKALQSELLKKLDVNILDLSLKKTDSGWPVLRIAFDPEIITKEQIENATNYDDLPTATAICLGMGIELPKNIRGAVDDEQPQLTIFPKNAEAEDIDIPYTDYEQYTNKINELRDSIKISDYDIMNLNSERMLLNQKILQLTDSTRKMHLYSQVQSSKLNESMRLLSQSLRLMFDNEYKGALDAIDAAIELSPNLAIAYSRKGAIYYRMGDPQRAAMYWNIALKIDPEFEEIYDMLDALKDDRIELNSVDN